MDKESEDIHSGQHSECFYCNQNKEFVMPQALIKDLGANKLVVFAGAGVSTENRKVFYWTLFEEIKGEIELKDNQNVSFSKAMSLFESKFGKKELIQRIKKRFDYVEAFPELYRQAVNFHRELSTISNITEIVTTNWDDYFERECGAIPIVTGEDFGFWDIPQRRVLKLHGSVSSYGSIVATEEEYRKKYIKLRGDPMWAHLVMSLATKTLIFFGYSFQDEDFNKVYNSLARSMGAMKPKIYIVSPHKKDAQRLKKLNAIGIDTDATFFLKKLKQQLVQEKRMIPDENFSFVYKGLIKIQQKHLKLGKKPYILKMNPETLFLSAYQDGIIHAFERILAKRKDGSYSCPHCIMQKIDSYRPILKEKRKAKLYHDIAYIEGYMNGMMYLLADKELRDFFPIFYLFGYGTIGDEADYLKLRMHAKKLHKASFKYAEGWIRHHKITSSDIIANHLPFL